MDFITLRILDVIDIILVAFLLYQIYRLIRGTVAINIFIGIFSVYLIWLIVKALNMQLLSTILGQFMGVGMIALIIVFQQEIRRFLLIIGSRYKFDKHFSFEGLMTGKYNVITQEKIEEVITVCYKLSLSKTGALISLTRKSELINFTSRGELLNSEISAQLIESIFAKSSPLHDGALVIVGNRIKAARCIFPVSESAKLPAEFGLRHRAALGITENTDALVIVVSEETGKIVYMKEGAFSVVNSQDELREILRKDLL